MKRRQTDTLKHSFLIISYLSCFFMMILQPQVSAEKTNIFDLSLEELMNISIATRTPIPMEEAPSIVSVVTASEIRNMGARNIEDVLRSVPGFDITNDNRQFKLNARGIYPVSPNNNKFRIEIDGHHLCADYFGGVQTLIKFVPVNSINRIEIMRSPGSALYGANAFLGVINIVTKKGGDAPCKVSFITGSFNTYKPTVEFSHMDDNFQAYLYADYYKTNGPELLVNRDAASFGEANSATPGKTVETEESYCVLSTFNYKDFTFNGLILNGLELQPKVGVAYFLTDEDDCSQSWHSAQIKYMHHFFNDYELTLKTFYNQYNYEMFYEIFPEETAEMISSNWYPAAEPYPSGEGIHGSPFSKSERYGVELMLNTNIRDIIDLTGGINYEQGKHFNVTLGPVNSNLVGHPYTLNNGYRVNPLQYLGGFYTDDVGIPMWSEETKRKIFAVYIQTVVDLKKIFSLEKGAENLSLTAGVRHDDYDDIGTSTNPRMGIIYAPFEKLYLKVLYGEAFRAPNFDEMHAVNTPSNWGNPDLKPERIKTYEGQIGYNFTSNIKSNLTFFYIKGEAFIGTTYDEIKKQYTYKNFGTIESQGIEGEVKYMWDKSRYAFANFTLSSAKNTTNAVIPLDNGDTSTQKNYKMGGGADFFGNIGFNYNLFQWFNANMSLNYVGQRDRTEEMIWREEKLEKSDPRDPTKKRFLLNASLAFKTMLKSMEIRLSGFNLLDEDHRDPDLTMNLDDDLPRAGRTFTAKISYKF